VARFVLTQHAAMPDYLRIPMRCLVLAFDAWAMLWTGRPFHALQHERRWRFVEAWSRSPLGFQRDLVKFFESLVLFGWFAETERP